MELSLVITPAAGKGRGHPIGAQDFARCWATRNHVRIILTNPRGALASGHPGKCSSGPVRLQWSRKGGQMLILGSLACACFRTLERVNVPAQKASSAFHHPG